jgi:cysteinyl-tRNA synthetase
VGIDIHGGGLDLRFPHHENELAQSRGAGRPFARTWMHNGMIELHAEKMSKSIGNVVSLREALDRWGREAVLVFFLGGHYRSALQYSDATMQGTRAQADDFRQAFRVAAARPSDFTWNSFADALDDDFDTPRALAVLHGWRAAGQLGLLSRGLDVFGIAIDTPGAVAPPDALRLAEARRAARARRDYAEADRLRAEIERLGWELQDGADGVRLIPKVR